MSDDETDWGASLSELSAVGHAPLIPPPPSGLPRVIIHIDLDCFYAQVEMVRQPALRSQPMGVRQKQMVITTNYTARARGIPKSGSVQALTQAYPELILVNGEDLYEYRRFSQRIFEVVSSMTFAHAVERLGMDENFIDVTPWVHAHLSAPAEIDPSPVQGHVFQAASWDKSDPVHRCLALGSVLAQRIRTRIREELGLTSAAGIAVNKTLAKLVGGCHKPDDQTLLLPDQTLALLQTLPSPRSIPGIGSATHASLLELGIDTLADLQAAQVSNLAEMFDRETAERLIQLSQGIDPSPVKTSGRPQSIGLEDRFKVITTRDESKTKLKWLWGRLAQLIYEDGRIPRVIRVTARDQIKERAQGRRWLKESRQTQIAGHILTGLKTNPDLPQREESQVVDICLSLLDKMVNHSAPYQLTLLGIGVSDFPPETANTIQNYFVAGAKETRNEKRQPKRSHAAMTPPNEEAMCQPTPDIDEAIRPCSKKVKPAPLAIPVCDVSDIPHDWDPEVWANLPMDIRTELLASQPIQSRTNVKPLNKKTKSIASYFQKKS
ncbi:hypothetical protein TCAL_00417 [Tigriopus californicus]|uniref:UmuC domain-containing protein n=1 Tax=Tigriopus californicus TaxID=6832 RepID=A0A553NB18_TIGCA|nr:DNA polymerase iota-like [Tigriopus californicus]TRY62618.1 hypothetical protein TCAL_00417 [Tigriopus californicus]|eukprot:TCALIF_00417-PA protein Name:"Similar to POLI DNA polymerase iota (Homo sapiens)" AED:0.36 eAED:0.36 QI:0/-1/0/1/-1/1/1/0/549